MKPIVLLVSLGVLCAAEAEAWAGKSDGYMAPRGRLAQIGEAKRVEKEIPTEITLQVGQRRSFSDVFTAGTFSPKVIAIMVAGGVLTIQAVGPGQAEVLVGTSKKQKKSDGEYKPKKMTVKVKR